MKIRGAIKPFLVEVIYTNRLWFEERFSTELRNSGFLGTEPVLSIFRPIRASMRRSLRRVDSIFIKKICPGFVQKPIFRIRERLGFWLFLGKLVVVASLGVFNLFLGNWIYRFIRKNLFSSLGWDLSRKGIQIRPLGQIPPK